MTHAELMERMSSKEINEWMAFAQLEPFGSEAGYLGHAITAATVANSNRGKNQKAAKITEFMPKFGKEEQGLDEMLSIAAMMTIGLGGQDLRQEPTESEDG